MCCTVLFCTVLIVLKRKLLRLLKTLSSSLLKTLSGSLLKTLSFAHHRAKLPSAHCLFARYCGLPEDSNRPFVCQAALLDRPAGLLESGQDAGHGRASASENLPQPVSSYQWKLT